MSEPQATFFFDFTDPLSFLIERELVGLAPDVGSAPRRVPLELRPPPTPLIRIDDPSIAGRWSDAREIAASLGVRLAPPSLVPWSRKAHELHAFAAARAHAPEVRRAVFEAFMLEGRDIGRVDVLVEIGRAAGLDPTETKATLDVDRHETDVLEGRASAHARGVAVTPTLTLGDRRLEGFHNRSALGTFLRGS